MGSNSSGQLGLGYRSSREPLPRRVQSLAGRSALTLETEMQHLDAANLFPIDAHFLLDTAKMFS